MIHIFRILDYSRQPFLSNYEISYNLSCLQPCQCIKRCLTFSLQDNLALKNSRKEGQDRRRKRNSRDSDSRERLTDKPSGEKSGSIDFVTSVTDCCCIGPRSRLPLSRIPLSSTVGQTSPTLPQPPTRVAAVEPPNPKANNNRGWLQTGSGTSANFSVGHGPQPTSSSTTSPLSNVSSSTTTATSTSTATTATTSVTNSVSVPRQLAQWTKHQTLKLQVSSFSRLLLKQTSTFFHFKTGDSWLEDMLEHLLFWYYCMFC